MFEKFAEQFEQDVLARYFEKLAILDNNSTLGSVGLPSEPSVSVNTGESLDFPGGTDEALKRREVEHPAKQVVNDVKNKQVEKIKNMFGRGVATQDTKPPRVIDQTISPDEIEAAYNNDEYPALHRFVKDKIKPRNTPSTTLFDNTYGLDHYLKEYEKNMMSSPLLRNK